MDHLLPDGVATKLGPQGRYELRIVLFALAIAILGIPFGLLLHQVATHGPLTGFDEDGAAWLNDRFHDQATSIRILEAISFLGKPIFLVFAVGLPVLWLLRHGGRRLPIFLVVTCLGGGIIDTIVKVAVGRPRPEVDEPILTAFGKSFPSGHSMQAVVCYGALLVVFLPLCDGWKRRAAITATIVVILAIGFSRLTLGVHFVSDVLGGYALGAAWLLASIAAFEIWREERGRRPTRPLDEGVEPEETRELVESA
jgi:membrane-associated phospholipid phosphatase